VRALAGVVPVESMAGPHFVQDSAEIGYCRSPPGAATLESRTVIGELKDRWFREQVGADTSYFIMGASDGGTIEASPPISGNPYGRAIVGLSGKLDTATKKFIEDQKLQTKDGRLIELPVEWLQVGHADEVFTIVPAQGGDGFRVLVADLESAINLLRENPGDETTGGFRTRAEILAFYDAPVNRARRDAIIARLAEIREKISTGLRVPQSRLIKVPVAFEVHTAPAKCYLPNIVNMLVVNRAGGVRRLVVPWACFRPFSVALNRELTAVGYRSSEVEIIDTREPHNGAAGEAHCVTNSRRDRR
jgi:protein-arginine deiminase